MTYTKLFPCILDSTVWREDDPTLRLWITLLAMADADGLVRASIPGLADRARISLEECKRAMEKFQSPDEYSTTPDDDGRRVRRTPDGWLLINHTKYMYTMSRDDRLEKQRERQKRYRERRQDKENKQCDAGDVTERHGDAGDVCDGTRQDKTIHIQDKTNKSICANAQNGRFHPPNLEQVRTYCQEKKFPIDPQTFLDYYEARGWKYKGNIPMKDWKSAVRLWNSNRKARLADDNHKETERRLQRQRDNELFLAAENDARLRGTLREDPK